MKQKLIDADAFNRMLLDNYHGSISDSQLYVYQILRLVYEAPTIDPIHAAGALYCKECKYFYPDANFCGHHQSAVKPDGFCNNGK